MWSRLAPPPWTRNDHAPEELEPHPVPGERSSICPVGARHDNGCQPDDPALHLPGVRPVLPVPGCRAEGQWLRCVGASPLALPTYPMKLTRFRDGRRGLSPLGGLLLALVFSLLFYVLVYWMVTR